MDKQITLKVTDGFVEILGVELAQNVDYQFSHRKLALFSWEGATLMLDGQCSVEYVGRETPMHAHLNLHLGLDQMRSSGQCPRLLVLGPADAGKTCLVKTLSNYAAKLAVAREGHGQCPILVDLDTNEGNISLQGTLAAMVIARPLDVEEEFSAPITLTKTSPLVYYYGSHSPLDKPRLYNSLVTNLATAVEKKLDDPLGAISNLVKNAGMIIDTPAQFTESAGLSLLQHTIDAFKVNVIVVIGQERLYSDVMKHYPRTTSNINVMRIPKSGGVVFLIQVVSRDKQFRRQVYMQRIKEYFYGTIRTTFTPFSQTVSFSDVVVRRVAEASIVPSSALPIGHERKLEEAKFVKVECGDILLHSVLAVSSAALPGAQEGGETKIYTPEEESNLLLSNILGFIYISEVDEAKRKMTVLMPNPGKLPKTFLIMGALKWMDS